MPGRVYCQLQSGAPRDAGRAVKRRSQVVSRPAGEGAARRGATSAAFLCHPSTFLAPKPVLSSFHDLLGSHLTSSSLPPPRPTPPSTQTHNSCAIAQLKAARAGSLGNAGRLCRARLPTGRRGSAAELPWKLLGQGQLSLAFERAPALYALPYSIASVGFLLNGCTATLPGNEDTPFWCQ